MCRAWGLAQLMMSIATNHLVGNKKETLGHNTRSTLLRDMAEDQRRLMNSLAFYRIDHNSTVFRRIFNLLASFSIDQKHRFSLPFQTFRNARDTEFPRRRNIVRRTCRSQYLMSSSIDEENWYLYVSSRVPTCFNYLRALSWSSIVEDIAVR